MLDLGLSGKTALVTGAASGIGRAIAIALANEGVTVALADRNDSLEVEQTIDALTGNAFPFKVDVSDRTNLESVIDQVIDQLGGLDLYVNNAAVAIHLPAVEIDQETWDANIDTNLAACVWAGARIARHMRKRESGSILIIGSTSIYTPRASEAVYRISKVGLKAYMEVLAIEMAEFGVRVNMLTPGSFQTGLSAEIPSDVLQAVEAEIPMGRIGEPHELASTALLLLSDRASPYTTGTNFIVDGGLHLRPIR